MKKCLAYLTAIALAAFPAAAQALSADLFYDDGDFEASTKLGLPAVPPPSIPPASFAPAVQFDAPGTGVFALDSVSFSLQQVPADPGAPTEGAVYPVTVQIWNLAPGPGTNYVPGLFFNDNLDVSTTAGEYTIDLTGAKLIFSGSIRIGIFLRDDYLDPTIILDPVPIPPVPVHLLVDTDGADSTLPMPFGHSYGYDSTVVPPAWFLDNAANYAISASVHDVPTLTCQGFLPPLNRTITMKKGGRTIPLKAFLFDDTGAPVTRRGLTSPPLVQLFLGQEDVTDEVAPAGRSNKGQAFRSTGGGRWMYNFKTQKSLAPGTYTVLTGSGDVTEYVIDPPCIGEVVVEDPVSKKPHPTKGPK